MLIVHMNAPRREWGLGIRDSWIECECGELRQMIEPHPDGSLRLSHHRKHCPAVKRCYPGRPKVTDYVTG